MSRTTVPKVVSYIDKKGNRLFAIIVLYHSRITQKGVSKKTGGYPSEAEALKDVPYYVHALNSISRGHKLKWKPFGSRSEAQRTLMHSTAILLFPPAVSTALSVVESQFKTCQKKYR